MAEVSLPLQNLNRECTTDSSIGPMFQKLDLGVSSCYEIGRRVYAPAKALYVSTIHHRFIMDMLIQDRINLIRLPHL